MHLILDANIKQTPREYVFLGWLCSHTRNSWVLLVQHNAALGPLGLNKRQECLQTHTRIHLHRSSFGLQSAAALHLTSVKIMPTQQHQETWAHKTLPCKCYRCGWVVFWVDFCKAIRALIAKSKREPGVVMLMVYRDDEDNKDDEDSGTGLTIWHC